MLQKPAAFSSTVKVVSVPLVDELDLLEGKLIRLDLLEGEAIKLEDEPGLLEGKAIRLEEVRLEKGLLDTGLLDMGDGLDEALSPAAVQLTIVAVELSPLPWTPKLCEAPGAILPFQSTLRAE